MTQPVFLSGILIVTRLLRGTYSSVLEATERVAFSIADVPDSTSDVSYCDSTSSAGISANHVSAWCHVNLKSRGSPLLVAANLSHSKVQIYIDSRVIDLAKTRLVRRSAEFAFQVPRSISSKESSLEVHVGRLRYAPRQTKRIEGCPGEALLTIKATCPSGDKSKHLYAGLTLAVLRRDGGLVVPQGISQFWILVIVGNSNNAVDGHTSIANDASLKFLRKLADQEGQGAFLVAFDRSPSRWAATHATHPRMKDMGSFIAPSEMHPRGIILPLGIGTSSVSDTSNSPVLPLSWVIAKLLRKRLVKVLEISLTPSTYDCEEVMSIVVSAERLLLLVEEIRVSVAGGGVFACEALVDTLRSHGYEQPQIESMELDVVLKFRLAGADRATVNETIPRFLSSPLWMSDRVTQTGINFQASIPVATLDELGQLKIPPNVQVWVEVGSNNWELLRDYLPPNVFLLTFEPLIDKYVFLADLARRSRGHHVVLPFAVASDHTEYFAAIRSQNYSNFRGESGRSFQESGASSLLPYAPGYMDHRWNDAALQYKNFREYLVPTVSLEWVMDRLLGERDVDYLKIDAQGLDFEVFRSAGRHARRVKRVQMELHEHVRHAGETQCSEVVASMEGQYRFRTVRGQFEQFRASWHDEVDIVFERH